MDSPPATFWATKPNAKSRNATVKTEMSAASWRIIEEQFLDAAPVEAKLNQTDFASFFSDWLDDRQAQRRPRAVHAEAAA